jgi:tetratricopeptide (TPR) repeat protein
MRVTARLRHPRILPLYDSGESSGWLYYVMPHVAGGSLRDRLLRGERYTLEDACRLLHEIATALAHAHEHGVLHRDVKPENVLLDESGAVLADFGIASAIARAAGDDDHTSLPYVASTTASTRGTPAYMSPEQITGDAEMDHRSDLYSLGVLAYEVLTGVHPFGGRTPAEMLAAHLTEAPTPVGDLRADLPPPLANLVMALLRKRPSERPANATAVVDALAAEPRAIRARRDASIQPSTRWTKGQVILVVLAIAAASIDYAMTDAGPSPRPPLRPAFVAPLTNQSSDTSLTPLGRVVSDYLTSSVVRLGFDDVTPSPSTLYARGDDGLRSSAAAAGASIMIGGTYSVRGDSIRIVLRIVEFRQPREITTLPAITVSRVAPHLALEPLREQVLAALEVQDNPLTAIGETAVTRRPWEAFAAMARAAAFADRGDWQGALPYYQRAASYDTVTAGPVTLLGYAYVRLAKYAEADSVLRIAETRRPHIDEIDRARITYLHGLIDGNLALELSGAREQLLLSPGAQLPRHLSAVAALRAGDPLMSVRLAKPIATTFGQHQSRAVEREYWFPLVGAEHLLRSYGDELRDARLAGVYMTDSPDARSLILRAFVGLGRVDSVRAAFRQLTYLSGSGSLPTFMLVTLGEELAVHGHPSVAREAWLAAVEHDRVQPAVERERPYERYWRAEALYLLGDYSRARLVAGRLVHDAPGQRAFMTQLARIASRLGDFSVADSLDRAFRSVADKYDHGETAYLRAQLASVRGRVDEAFERLTEARREGLGLDLRWHRDPDLAPLRRDPRFQTLANPGS